MISDEVEHDTNANEIYYILIRYWYVAQCTRIVVLAVEASSIV